jgi:serine/threonine protein kinase
MSSRSETASSAALTAASAAEALVGKRINKYEIVRIIGQGGMGTVYEALNTAIGKRVAMKFVDAEVARNRDAAARFQREAEAASAVESAHIVEIFDSGSTDDGTPYIVMELLRGEDLGHRIKRCGRLEVLEALHIGAQILRGLHRAHQAGIIHRDLKPDNIFLVDRDDDSSFAKILDFGISKVSRSGEGAPVHTLTRQGTVLGTPFYMSPEQAQALSDIDGRTDLWSVGAILYECLSGRAPYNGATYEQVIVNICMHDAEDVRKHNAAVPEAVAQVIARALTRDRTDRFATAREFLDSLKVSVGMISSSRPGHVVNEDSGLSRVDTPSSDYRRMLLGSGATPTPATTPHRTPTPVAGKGDVLGIEATLEVNPAGTSKVGWSTSRRAAARREKRTFFAVAVSALLVGAVGAFLIVRSRMSHGEQDGSKGVPAASSTAEVQAVNPVPVPMPSGQEVPPAAAQGVPTVSPVADAPVSTAVEPGRGGKVVRASKSGEPIAVLPPLPKASVTPSASAKASAAPVVVPPVVKPKPTGVGGELKLKTD